jgi:hypothetical protein
MTGDYEVVRYRLEHKARIALLQTYLWSTDVRLNAAYLEWKYEQNPYLDEPLIYLVEIGGAVVGMRGFFGGRWEAGIPPRASLVFCADDLVIAPEHRNRGLLTTIMRTALDDLAVRRRDGFALMLSPGSITVLNSLAAGWKSIGHMAPVQCHSERLGWSQRLLAFLGRQRGVWRAAAFAKSRMPARRERFTRLERNARRRPRALAGIRLARAPEPEAMARLVARLGYDGRIRHVRDAEYFGWRFRNPLHEYRFLYAGGSDLDGYLVLQRYRTGAEGTRVHISDWEAVDVRTRQALLEAAVTWGEFEQLRTWTASLSEQDREILRRAGFAEKAAGTPAEWPRVLVQSLRATEAGEWRLAGQPLLDLLSWDFRMLYAMSG